jgi:PAPA-1-like conserved region
MTLILFQLQAETINRLLKKQSTRQMKNKRFGGGSLTHTATATSAQATSDVEEGEGAEGEGKADTEEEEDNKRRCIDGCGTLRVYRSPSLLAYYLLCPWDGRS